jgi:hypothetical protein
LLTHAEAQALAELKWPGYVALDRLRGRADTDAVFLLQRIAALPGNGFTREAFSDAVDASFVLEPGADTPSRTLAHFAKAPVVFRHEAPARVRPDLRVEMARAPRKVRHLSEPDGESVVHLARGAMVTRARSLEAFSFANARDAWLVDDGDGLAYALMGVISERRHAVASYYGGLTLRNGVPIGYLQADVLGRSAALSFNTFETFRGGEAAFTFARWLAALHHMFGCTSFSVEPYQLGHDNDEALETGAWWFYAKLGFRPRAVATLRLAREELSLVARDPRHRTRSARLKRLAEQHVLRLRCGAAASVGVGRGPGMAVRIRAVHKGGPRSRTSGRAGRRRTRRPLRRDLVAWLHTRPARGLAPLRADRRAARHCLVARRRACGAGRRDPRQGRAQRA